MVKSCCAFDTNCDAPQQDIQVMVQLYVRLYVRPFIHFYVFCATFTFFNWEGMGLARGIFPLH